MCKTLVQQQIRPHNFVQTKMRLNTWHAGGAGVIRTAVVSDRWSTRSFPTDSLGINEGLGDSLSPNTEYDISQVQRPVVLGTFRSFSGLHKMNTL